jgi:hypothetical protein
MGQKSKVLIAQAFECREHLCGVASLIEDSYTLFEGVGKRSEGRKVAVIGMLVRDPKIVDAIEQGAIEFRLRPESPRIVENFSR